MFIEIKTAFYSHHALLYTIKLLVCCQYKLLKETSIVSYYSTDRSYVGEGVILTEVV